jgi:hypothetical protein
VVTRHVRRTLTVTAALALAASAQTSPATSMQSPLRSRGSTAGHVVTVDAITYSDDLIRTRQGKTDNWMVYAPRLSVSISLHLPDGMTPTRATARIEATSVRRKVCNKKTQGNNDKWGCFIYFDSDYIPSHLKIDDLGGGNWKIRIVRAFMRERNATPFLHTGKWRLTDLNVEYRPGYYWDYFERPNLDGVDNSGFKLRRKVHIGLGGRALPGHYIELSGTARHHVALQTYRNRFINQMRPFGRRKLQVWRVSGSGKRRHLRNVITDRRGRFRLEVNDKADAKWFLRYPGDGTNAAARSRTRAYPR